MDTLTIKFHTLLRNGGVNLYLDELRPFQRMIQGRGEQKLIRKTRKALRLIDGTYKEWTSGREYRILMLK